MQEIKKMFSLPENEAPENWGRKLVCPICGFDYVHFRDPILKKGGDNYEAWNGRGDCIDIPMYCENDHSWTVRLGAHKGNLYFIIIK